MREKTGGISVVKAGGGTLEFYFLICLSSVFPGPERVFLCGMWILVVLLSLTCLELQSDSAIILKMTVLLLQRCQRVTVDGFNMAYVWMLKYSVSLLYFV